MLCESSLILDEKQYKLYRKLSSQAKFRHQFIICTHIHVIRQEICLTLPLTMKLGELQKVQCKCDYEMLISR